jgi:hypothetical protein
MKQKGEYYRYGDVICCWFLDKPIKTKFDQQQTQHFWYCR